VAGGTRGVAGSCREQDKGDRAMRGRGWWPAPRPEGGAAAGGERLAQLLVRAGGGIWWSPRACPSSAVPKGLPPFSELGAMWNAEARQEQREKEKIF